MTYRPIAVLESVLVNLQLKITQRDAAGPESFILVAVDSSTSPRDWLGRTDSEMTYFVSSGMLNNNSVGQ